MCSRVVRGTRQVGNSTLSACTMPGIPLTRMWKRYPSPAYVDNRSEQNLAPAGQLLL